MRINICARPKYFLVDEENYLLIKDDEKVALNPIFVARIIQFVQVLQKTKPNENIILVARSVEIATILLSANLEYERDYGRI